MADHLMTVSQVARRLGVRVHRVAYALRCAEIREVQRAGIVRLYSADQLDAIREAIEVRQYPIPHEVCHV